MVYKILQLKHSESFPERHKMFASWEELKHYGGFNLSDYTEVYSSEIGGEDADDVLDNLYCLFNMSRPDSFKGHSLSVSDVVVLDGVKYYCDTFGWRKVD